VCLCSAIRTSGVHLIDRRNQPAYSHDPACFFFGCSDLSELPRLRLFFVLGWGDENAVFSYGEGCFAAPHPRDRNERTWARREKSCAGVEDREAAGPAARTEERLLFAKVPAPDVRSIDNLHIEPIAGSILQIPFPSVAVAYDGMTHTLEILRNASRVLIDRANSTANPAFGSEFTRFP
jgi:hypothetical protein